MKMKLIIKNLKLLFPYNRLIPTILFLGLISGNPENKNNLVGSISPNWALKTTSGDFEFLNNYSVVPDLELRDNGDDNQKRKVVIISFFATWCEPCIKEIRELQLLKDQYAEKPVQFFLIDLTEYFRKGEGQKYNKAKKAAPFLNDLNLAKIPILEDNRGIVANKYGVSNNIPRLFVIDKYQTIQFDGANECPTCIQDILIPILDKLTVE